MLERVGSNAEKEPMAHLAGVLRVCALVFSYSRVQEAQFIHNYLDALTETLANLAKHEADLERVRLLSHFVIRFTCVSVCYSRRFALCCRTCTRLLLSSANSQSFSPLSMSPTRKPCADSSACSNRSVCVLLLCVCVFV